MQNQMSEFKHWIGEQLGASDFHFAPLPGDASFRSYYRISRDDQTYIAMLAPPTKERTDAFVAIGSAWKQQGLNVPEIFGWEQAQGFVLLSDFGDVLLLDVLSVHCVQQYYRQAQRVIVSLQGAALDHYALPLFDESYVRQELNLFREWFLDKLLGKQETPEESNMLDHVFSELVRVFVSQPQTTVHRDFHSRNLMVLHDESLGIIDFQDAMLGPITYDLVSLLKDCYIDWPTENVRAWAQEFYHLLIQQKKLQGIDYASFMTWFDWVGLQRHIKVLGIFSRLKLRDNKAQYLQYFPRIINYVLDVTSRYPTFSSFHRWLEHHIMPSLQLLSHKVA